MAISMNSFTLFGFHKLTPIFRCVVFFKAAKFAFINIDGFDKTLISWSFINQFCKEWEDGGHVYKKYNKYGYLIFPEVFQLDISKYLC